MATPFGQRVDAASLGQIAWIGPPPGRLFRAARSLIPIVLAVLAAGAIVAGLVRRRWGDTLFAVMGAAVVVAGTGIVRDDILHRPYLGAFGYTTNSYPSRHVAISFVLCLVIVKLWPWVRGAGVVRVCAAVVTVMVGLASVQTFAHRASDVFGGILLVGLVAPLFARGVVPNARSALLRRPPALYVVVAATLGSAVLACVPGPVATWGFSVGIAVGGSAIAVLVLRVAGGPENVPARNSPRTTRRT